jgi:type I restriction enzyme S subunit
MKTNENKNQNTPADLPNHAAEQAAPGDLPNRSTERPLPDGWTWTTIGDITQPIEKVKPQDEPDKEFTYLDISGIDNKRNVVSEPKVYYGVDAPSRARQSVKAGDILFSTVRTYLKNIAQVPEQYDGQVASTGFSILRGRERISNKYLFYYSLTETFLTPLGELQRGSSYPAVRDSDVREQPIPLAPFVEQEHIVAEIEKQFTRLDQAVASLRRLQGHLTRYKASVLKAACEGQLVPQDENDEPASELLARILAERRAQWEAANPGKMYKEPAGVDTAGLPELPEEWVWTILEKVSLLDIGSAFKSKEFSAHGIPLLRGDNIEPGSLRWENTKYWPIEKLDPFRYLLITEGDIILAMDRPLISSGLKIARAKAKDLPCLLVQRMARFNPVEKRITEFLYLALQTENFVRHLQKGQTGTQLPHISGKGILSFVFALPPLAEQNRIVAEVEQRLSVVAAMEQAITANLSRAERLRQSILHRAFTGRLVTYER